MPLILLAVFILVPVAELYVIIKIGGAIGLVPTLFLLIADAILGSMLLRSQGRAAWVRLNRALAENRIPAKEVVDGVLIVFGGALLLTPGFLTDIVGLILLIPPTRAMVRGFMRRFVIGRFAMGPRAAVWGYGQVRDRRGAPGESGDPAGPAGPGGPGGPFEEPPPRRPRPSAAPEDFDWTSPHPANPHDDVIEGTAHELDDEDEQLPPGERGTFPG